MEWVYFIICLGCFLSIPTSSNIWGGAMPARTCTKGMGVGFKHLVIKQHVSFKPTSTFFA